MGLIKRLQAGHQKNVAARNARKVEVAKAKAEGKIGKAEAKASSNIAAYEAGIDPNAARNGAISGGIASASKLVSSFMGKGGQTEFEDNSGYMGSVGSMSTTSKFAIGGGVLAVVLAVVAIIIFTRKKSR